MPLYKFWRLRRKQPLLDQTVQRHEQHLVSLSSQGILVDVEDPQVKRHTGASGTWVVIRGRATMNSGIGLMYMVRLRVQQTPRGIAVTDQERSYSALIVGEGVLMRYDSGHSTHKHDPHLHDGWAKDHGLSPPTLRIDRPVELNEFVDAIERWRSAYSSHLPANAPCIGDIALPYA